MQEHPSPPFQGSRLAGTFTERLRWAALHPLSALRRGLRALLAQGALLSPVSDGLRAAACSHRPAPASSPGSSPAAGASRGRILGAGRPATAAPGCWSPSRSRTPWTHRRGRHPSCPKTFRFVPSEGEEEWMGLIKGLNTPPLEALLGWGCGRQVSNQVGLPASSERRGPGRGTRCRLLSL